MLGLGEATDPLADRLVSVQFEGDLIEAGSRSKPALERFIDLIRRECADLLVPQPTA